MDETLVRPGVKKELETEKGPVFIIRQIFVSSLYDALNLVMGKQIRSGPCP